MRISPKWLAISAVCMMLASLAAAENNDADTVDYRPLHSWPFTAGDSHGWRWMSEVLKQDERGVSLAIKKNGPFMRLNDLSQRALDVSAVEIALDYEDGADNTMPKGMRLYWARAADSERDNSWPFSNERSAPFVPIEGDEAGRWRADVAFHGNWIGTITALFIEFTLPDDAQEEGGQLLLRELILMEEIWESKDIEE